MEDLTCDETFLQGWIGERIAALWLEFNGGYKVQCRVPQARGSEKSKSSGDVDLIATKDGETIYAEVKCWGKKSCLNPSWLVQFMLDRKKLNTLFERHDKATKHMLIFRYAAPGNFRYSNKKYIETLINKYGVQKNFLEKLSGQSNARFAEETLKYLIRKDVNRALDVQIIYFKQIIKELHDLNCLNEIKALLKTELEGHFDYSFLDIEHT